MKKLFILICLFSLSFYSCAIRNALAPKVGLDASRTFTAQVMKGGNSAGYFNFPSTLIKTTDSLAIYLENGKNVSLYALNKMAQEFDYCYDRMTNIYGGHSDVDGNGKIIILLMQINAEGKNGSTLAYFNPNDMYNGNYGEILYMDIDKVNDKTDNAIGTLIHEFQHLINYSHYLNGERRAMDSWLNEALSESTSVLFNKATAKSRIEEFNNISNSYYCFYTWDLPNSYGFVNYPSASIFMHWLYNKNGSNSKIFKEIAQSSQPLEYMKVLTAAKECGIISNTNTWEDLLFNWMSDMITNNNVPKVDSTNASVKTNAESSVNLYPGMMVVSTKSTTQNGNIVVRKVNSANIILNKDTTLETKTTKPTSISVSLSGS